MIPVPVRDGWWKARERQAQLHVCNFDHLGTAQQAIFRHSNGFHDWHERDDYEAVGLSTSEVTESLVTTPAAPAAPKPVRSRPSRITQPLEECEEQTAVAVYIKGWDPVVR